MVTPHVKGLPQREVQGSVLVERIPFARRHADKAALFDMVVCIIVGIIHYCLNRNNYQ